MPKKTVLVMMFITSDLPRALCLDNRLELRVFSLSRGSVCFSLHLPPLPVFSQRLSLEPIDLLFRVSSARTVSLLSLSETSQTKPNQMCV